MTKKRNYFPEPFVADIRGDRHYILKQEFSYLYKPAEDGGKGGAFIVIEPGFETDLASVPRFFWRLYPPDSKCYFKAALIHDALYASEYYSRETCDEIFREAMQREGCSLLDRNVIYYAVRSFGWAVWCKHKRAAVRKAKELVSIKIT